MKLRLYFLALFAILLFAFHCGPTEPESPYGSLRIVMVKDSPNSLSKTADVLESVLAIVVKNGSNTKSQYLSRKPEGGFHGEIKDLEPGDNYNYSVLLYGRNTSEVTTDFTRQTGISVRAGEQSVVNMPTWSDFKPLLQLPANNGNPLTNTTVNFDWSDVTTARMYELQSENDSTFNNPGVTRTSSQYTPSSPLTPDTYYWRVRAQDEQSNWGSWSDVWRFTIQAETTPALCVSPTSLDFGSSETSKTFNITNCGNGTLTWTITDDSNWITVSPTSGSTTSETDVITVTVNRSGLSPGDYNGTVTVNSNGGTEQVGVSMSVGVPDPPTLLSPANGSIIITNTLTDFDWTDVATAIVYELQFENDSTLTNEAVTVTSSQYTPSSSLTPDTYYWRVRARDNNGNRGDWSEVWSFTISTSETVSTPNTPTGPSNGQVGQSLSFSTGDSTSNLGHSVEYRFDWGDGTPPTWGSSTQSHSYTIFGNYSVKAEARCQTHTSVVSTLSSGLPVTISGHTLSISVSPSGAGSVTKNPNKTQYNHNETVQLTAVPGSDYKFDRWGGDLSGSNSTTSINMSGDKSVIAYFVLIEETWTGTPVKDAHVTQYINDPRVADSNYGTYSILSLAGSDIGNSRILIDFDFLTQIPPAVIIKNAWLTFHVPYFANPKGSPSVHIGWITGTWSETTVTWNNQPLASYYSSREFQIGVGAGNYQVIDVTEEVQRMVQDGYNEGFKILCTLESGSEKSTIYDSRSASTANYRPSLAIVYTQ